LRERALGGAKNPEGDPGAGGRDFDNQRGREGQVLADDDLFRCSRIVRCSVRSRPRRPAVTHTRPTAARRPHSRKRQSALDRLFNAVALPAAGLFGLWVYVNTVTGK
jgi:hypothetical protein